MIVVDDKVLSTELFDTNFCCDLSKCKGACCVHGESGAPLEEEEKELLEKNLPKILPYLRPESQQSIEEQGVAVVDADGDLVTPLLNGEECVYAVFENGVALCGIEKAFFDKKQSFRKPVSCHLYPIRVAKLHDMEALNYHHWEICDPARELGNQKKLPVYKFLKDALIRKYGKKWYRQLDDVADAYDRHKKE